MPVHNTEIAAMFHEVADLLESQEANPLRVRAYRKFHRQWPGFRAMSPRSCATMTIEPSYPTSACEIRRVYNLVGVLKYRNFTGKGELDEILAGTSTDANKRTRR